VVSSLWLRCRGRARPRGGVICAAVAVAVPARGGAAVPGGIAARLRVADASTGGGERPLALAVISGARLPRLDVGVGIAAKAVEESAVGTRWNPRLNRMKRKMLATGLMAASFVSVMRTTTRIFARHHTTIILSVAAVSSVATSVSHRSKTPTAKRTRTRPAGAANAEPPVPCIMAMMTMTTTTILLARASYSFPTLRQLCQTKVDFSRRLRMALKPRHLDLRKTMMRAVKTKTTTAWRRARTAVLARLQQRCL
jgi:hypothetical protein